MVSLLLTSIRYVPYYPTTLLPYYFTARYYPPLFCCYSYLPCRAGDKAQGARGPAP